MAGRFKSLSQKVHDTLGDEKRNSFQDGDTTDGKRRGLIETFGDNDVAMWIELITKYPTLQNITFLHTKLDKEGAEWIGMFLEQSGLENMFDVLNIFTNKGSLRGISHMDDAVAFLQFVRCIRSLMKTKLGLEYFVSKPEISRNIMSGKSTFLSMY